MEQLLRELLNAPIREQFVVLSVVAIVLALGFGFVGATIGAYFGGRYVASVLFGLEPTNAMTIGASVVILLAVSLVAGFLPARRASRVDPLAALRVE